MPGEIPSIRVIIVGDGGSGKTALVFAYFQDVFKDDYISTTLDMYEYNTKAKSGKEVEIKICDTSGQEGYEEIRKLQYEDATLFMVCYDVIAITSFNNVSSHWIGEVNREAPDCPAVLVGTKLDLAETVHEEYVTEEMAEEMRENCEFFSAHQCSSKDYVANHKASGRVDEVFISVIECGLKRLSKGGKKRRGCTLL